MRRTDPSNKNRPEGNTNTLPPPTYTRIYPRCFNSTVIYMCRCPALNPRKHRRLLVWQALSGRCKEAHSSGACPGFTPGSLLFPIPDGHRKANTLQK